MFFIYFLFARSRLDPLNSVEVGWLFGPLDDFGSGSRDSSLHSFQEGLERFSGFFLFFTSSTRCSNVFVSCKEREFSLS